MSNSTLYWATLYQGDTAHLFTARRSDRMIALCSAVPDKRGYTIAPEHPKRCKTCLKELAALLEAPPAQSIVDINVRFTCHAGNETRIQQFIADQLQRYALVLTRQLSEASITPFTGEEA